MVFESLRELYVVGTGDGRTSKGLPVFVQGMDNTEKAIAAFTFNCRSVCSRKFI